MNARRTLLPSMPLWWLIGLLVLAACQGNPVEPTATAAPIQANGAAVAATSAPAGATATALPPDANHTPVPLVATPVVATATALPLNTPYPAERYQDYEIITVLPRDAIPAVFDPTFMDATTADSWYEPDELVIGVLFNDEARAYSVPYLSSHEIVNDEVGGVKIAVTW